MKRSGTRKKGNSVVSKKRKSGEITGRPNAARK
jgi:hypothetical protein